MPEKRTISYKTVLPILFILLTMIIFLQAERQRQASDFLQDLTL